MLAHIYIYICIYIYNVCEGHSAPLNGHGEFAGCWE